MGIVKEPWEIALMRQSGGRLAEVIATVREAVKPGVTTDELDEIAYEETIKRGAKPSFKGYQVGRVIFPKTICASVNEEIVHGIPGSRVLKEGDLVSLDFGLVFNGYHADSAFTVALGDTESDVAKLVTTTEESLYKSIEKALPGNRIGDIAHAVQSHVEPFGFGIIREYGGHGIGKQLHQSPWIPNFGKPGRGSLLKPGMVVALEPMITLGGFGTKVLKDGWTVVTKDGSLASHFEHTVAITPGGPQILTRLPDA